MFYKYHRNSPWLKTVLVPFWSFQIVFMVALISVFIWLRAYTDFQSTDIIVLIISAACIVLSITEIILFAAIKLHPLTFLILQLVKTTIWFVLFVLAAVDTVRVQSEMEVEEENGYDLGNKPGFFFLSGFIETLVLFITFLSALIYASIIYHRHRRAKSRFFGSIVVHSTDLFPVVPADDEERGANPTSSPNNKSHRLPHTPRNTVKEQNGEMKQKQKHVKNKNKKETEAVEVTVLRELGGDWIGEEKGEGEVYELSATRSKRNSRGGKSVRSLKGVGEMIRR